MRFKNIDEYVAWQAERQVKLEPPLIYEKEIPDKGLESKLQAKIIRYALDNGFPCFHDRSRKKNTAGWPDLVLCCPNGIVLFLELKSKSGRLSKDQESMRLKFLFLKHNWYEVRSYKKFIDIINQYL